MKKILRAFSLAAMLASGLSMSMITGCSAESDSGSGFVSETAEFTMNVYLVTDGEVSANPMEISNIRVKTLFGDLDVFTDRECTLNWDGESEVESLYIKITTEEVIVAKAFVYRVLDGVCESEGTETILKKAAAIYSKYTLYTDESCSNVWDGESEVEKLYYAVNTIKIYTVKDGTVQENPAECLSDAISTTYKNKVLYIDEAGTTEWDGDITVKNLYLMTTAEQLDLIPIVIAGDFSSSKLATTADGAKKAYFDVLSYDPENVKAYGGGSTAGALEDGSYQLIFKVYGNSDGSKKICTGSDNLVKAFGETMEISVGAQKNLVYTGIQSGHSYRIWIESTTDENSFKITIEELNN